MTLPEMTRGDIMQLLVRPVQKGDWRAVLRVESTVTNPWDIEDHRDFLRQKRNATYVVTDGEALFGFVSVTVMPTHVLVERMAVVAEARKLGVGRGLLDSLEEFYVTPKRRQMQAVVSEYDLGTQLFFKSRGWTWAKTTRWADEMDEYLFVRNFP